MAGDGNTWRAKLKRSLTSLLPVAENREGGCKGCGACCELPTPCPFVGYDDEGKSFCKIYKIRPPVCRKYPRTEGEHVTQETCGFSFRKPYINP